ncbi:MAG: decaprenyl-phosphate phosphoribosyltransferase [Spirulina sp.]
MALQSPQTMKKKKAKKTILPYFLALRPRQWTKNLVIFAAPLFSFSLDLTSWLYSLFAFILFCGLSGSFYLVNDSLDVEADRQHPTKCKRPIAAGLVSVPEAIFMAIFLMVGTIVLGWRHEPMLGTTLIMYAVLQIAYNLKLKHTVILDVVAISLGFVLRAYAGAAASGVSLSSWFLLCTAMLALFLGVEKRKAELRLSQMKGGKSRKVLYRYSLPLLARMEGAVTTGAIMCYALWSSGPTVGGSPTPWMMLTLPFVLYGIFRYQLLSDPDEIARRTNGTDHGGQSERPEEVLLSDRPILLTVASWAATAGIILYLYNQGSLA